MTRSELASLKIIKYPDPRLRKACEPVTVVDDELRELAARMFELMAEAEGVGLAAPQVGVLKRLFVCNVTGSPGDSTVFVNPRLADFGEETAVAEEGCLSIPDVTVDVKRPTTCRIDAIDLDGNPLSMEGIALAARCWQHECDHLDGRLIIDRMSETERLANRRALKRLEAKFRL